MEQEEAY
ncbi:hypothetical protein S40288_11775 [Stachybotrys chartarum IBT 40288]|nr:hypothetical protein S40288_11775 [Stachybotrys chartarum IBT 40288]